MLLLLLGGSAACPICRAASAAIVADAACPAAACLLPCFLPVAQDSEQAQVPSAMAQLQQSMGALAQQLGQLRQLQPVALRWAGAVAGA